MWIPGSAIVIDRHVIAGISIIGTACDVMGGLYLAYDLLGGNNGPLRTLTRVVTYTLIFCVGYGLPFGLLFGLLSGTGLMAVYAFRLSPTDAYQPHVKPRLRPHELIASAMRGTSTALAGMIAALITHSGSDAFGFGLTFGIVAGTVSAIVSVFSPFVEWWADHLPARRLGAFGTMILLIGLILQSIQYWVVLLNVVVQ
jgi:hypothetical protein